jgi:hypothetical protein
MKKLELYLERRRAKRSLDKVKDLFYFKDLTNRQTDEET